MSFILDALKKSENDRQRQTGPALFEVKVAPPKAGFPAWAIAIVVLLAINMVIVGWLLLRRPSKSEEAAPPPVASQPAPTPPPSAAISQPAPTNSAPAQQDAPPPPPASGSRAPSTMQRSTQDEQSNGRGMSERDQKEPTLASGADGSKAEPGAPAGANSNPDDFAPAEDAGSPLFKGHVKRGTESGLMLYQDLAVANGANLPELRLDMHVYDPKPQARFALINMQKVTEGQMMKGEVKVEAITPEGVVMSHHGTRFLLPRE